MNRKNETVRSVVLGTVRRQPLLCTALVLAVAGAVAASLLPPLVLGRVVDRLTARQAVPFALALGYFGLLALSGGLDSLQESLLTVFGQRMTHALRSAMCAKLDKLPAEAFVNQESGAAVSRFVGDVDTVEELFTSGIISMKDKGITGPAEMAGHTYATWELPIEQGVIERCVEADGGDFSKVEMIPSTVTDEVTALSTDQVDSIWIYWAWAGEKCKLAGLDTNYFAFADIDPVFDFYTPVIIANNGVIEDDAEMVQAFMDATRRGYEDCIADPKGAAEILLKAAPELEEELVVASQIYLAEQYQADAETWGEIDQKRWDAFYEWVSDQGFADPIEPGAGMTDKFQG